MIRQLSCIKLFSRDDNYRVSAFLPLELSSHQVSLSGELELAGSNKTDRKHPPQLSQPNIIHPSTLEFPVLVSYLASVLIKLNIKTKNCLIMRASISFIPEW